MRLHLAGLPTALLFLSHLPTATSASAAAATTIPTPVTPIPIYCLARAIDTGEHVSDPATGKLRYSPFLQCAETKHPLQLLGSGQMNCTIPAVDDETYHMLEFYVHHDAPLACRLPRRLATEGRETVGEDEEDEESEEGSGWVPFLIALTGTLSASHLHVSTSLNVLLHTSHDGGALLAAAAYSTGATQERIVIGDALPLHFDIRWFRGPGLDGGVVAAGEEAGAGNGGWGLGLLLMLAGVAAGAAAGYTVGLRKKMAAGGIIGNFEKRGGYGYGVPKRWD